MSEERARDQAGRRLRPLLVTALASLFLLLAFSVGTGYRRLWTARQREQALEQRIQQTRQEIQRLQERIRRIQEDPGELERLAREELFLAREGELVLVLKDDPRRRGDAPPEASPALSQAEARPGPPPPPRPGPP